MTQGKINREEQKDVGFNISIPSHKTTFATHDLAALGTQKCAKECNIANFFGATNWPAPGVTFVSFA